MNLHIFEFSAEIFSTSHIVISRSFFVFLRYLNVHRTIFMKSILPLLVISFVLLTGCRASFWYNPDLSFHETSLSEASTVSIDARGGIISVENGENNRVTEIKSKGKKLFKWSQRGDTLYLSIPETTRNEYEIGLKEGQNVVISSSFAVLNLIQVSNALKISSHHSTVRLDQPPVDLTLNSEADSVFAGLSPDVSYKHFITLKNSYLNLVRNQNETAITELPSSSETAHSSNDTTGISIIHDQASEINIKAVGRIW